MTAPVPCTALWRPGQWRITIASPRGGQWAYDVMGTGDRPSHGWLIGTPWAIYPGAEWQEQPGGRDEHGKPLPPCWTVPVFLEQPGKLTDRQGNVTSG